MARTVPGSGAVIEPIFDEFFGVRAVLVKDGGSGYVQTDPPRLTVEGCGTPDEEALLYPIIDQSSGKIVHVRVLTRGRGYDPLRLQIVPEQETPTVVNSFNFKTPFANVNEPVISILFVVDLTLPVVANIPLPPPPLIPKLVVWNDAELSVPA